MPRYYLRIEWVDREFEVTKHEYEKTYKMHAPLAGHAPISEVPGQFKIGAIHGRIDKSEGGEWFEVAWGKPKQVDPPTDDEKQHIMKIITRKAKRERVFEMYVTEAIYKWLKENLKNAYITLVSQMDDVSHLNDHWIAVGISEGAVKKWVSRI